MFENTDLTVVALVRGSGTVQRRLIELGCKATFLIDRPQMGLRDIPRAYRLFRRMVRRLSPQFVIASLPQANLIARLALYFQRDITFVSFEHNTRLAKSAYEILFRMTSWRVDWVFADAEFTLAIVLKRLYRRRPLPENCFVVPLVEFRNPARTALAPQSAAKRFHVINAARLTDVKNQGSILRAVALMRDQGLPVHLTLYGEGPNRAAYAALADELGIAAYVNMPGFVADWPLQPADAFVLASRHEGLCIALLEAMYAGIPVIAPLIDGIQDYGSSDIMEVLPDVTPAALAQALVRTAQAPDVAAQKADYAAEMVEARYSTTSVRVVYRHLSDQFWSIVPRSDS